MLAMTHEKFCTKRKVRAGGRKQRSFPSFFFRDKNLPSQKQRTKFSLVLKQQLHIRVSELVDGNVLLLVPTY